MTLKLIWKLVVKNFNMLRSIIAPFILAAGVMFGLEYIMVSLINNDYIQKRHETLPMLISYANIIAGILTVIFVLYANHFVMKQRKQEFALHMILGLEKKHIRLMICLEMIIQMVLIGFISIVGGYLFGNLVFLILNKLVKGSGITLMNYPFDVKAAIVISVMILCVYILLFILNHIMITIQSPVQLMRSQKAGEEKTRKWFTVLCFIFGSIFLSYGYYRAMTVEGILSSFQTIFFAVLAVMIGTYLLFMSLTIIILQLLKKEERIYYQPKHFFSISGLISRMKKNAIGLASITMLVTFLVVTLGMTLTAYRGMESQVSGRLNQDYHIDIYSNTDVQTVKNEINRYAQVDYYRQGDTIFFPLQNIEGNLKKLPDNARSADAKTMIYAVVTTVKDHNQLHDDHLQIKGDEVILSANTSRFKGYQEVNLAEKSTKVVYSDKDYLGNQLAIDALYIVVKDKSVFEQIRQHYKSYDPNKEKAMPSEITTSMEFNIIKGEKEFKKHISEIQKKIETQIESKSEIKKMIFELNGGLIFIGIVVSIVLLTGIFLVLYYKQLSEGYEDKRNYSIMKKVGLPDELIRSTIHKQIFWVFGLPIIVTLVHTLFASKIIYNLLGVLGIRDRWMFITSYIGVTMIIMLVYGLMYLITSRKYYNIINE
ncbi:ABC transporter permease [Macrococcoides caseolyticum]|uniref:FtsX-like permease family protein n=1 Tax=Macrococcoides caseolyticum TaxID=69966 RepID=UPI000C31FE3A|nr:ABC transporter permease [Macrococcus caseolyticus]PKE35117.1 ABC transporter permease [Macrococcus caseolyticus]PKE73727.1 ABC transporter permease [Macrococcus caseolyticus]